MALYLVTGGAGFIGSHIVQALAIRGEHVRVLDNLSTGRLENLGFATGDSRLPGAVEVIEGDICDLETLRQAISGVDYVLHHAAMVSVPQSMADPLATHTVNATGTLNLLHVARHACVKRVVFASSWTVLAI